MCCHITCIGTPFYFETLQQVLGLLFLVMDFFVLNVILFLFFKWFVMCCVLEANAVTCGTQNRVVGETRFIIWRCRFEVDTWLPRLNWW